MCNNLSKNYPLLILKWWNVTVRVNESSNRNPQFYFYIYNAVLTLLLALLDGAKWSTDLLDFAGL